MKETFQREKPDEEKTTLPELLVPEYRARLMKAYRRIEAEYQKSQQLNDMATSQ